METLVEIITKLIFLSALIYLGINIFFWIGVPAAEHERRLSSRPGKSIPAHVMKTMKENLQFPTKDEGFNEIVNVA